MRGRFGRVLSFAASCAAARFAAATGALAAAWLTAATSVLAQADAASDRAQSFQAVTGGVQEDVAGGPLMLLAYAIVWIAVFGYVFRLSRLQRGVESNLERLERTVAAAPHAHE